jgi:hypothetical protein
LEIAPAQTSRGIKDRLANVRLLLTAGNMGNEVSANSIKTFLRKGMLPDLNNLTAAAGGADDESLTDMQARFAELLLTRERVVTHADLAAVITAYEPKVRRVEAQPALARSADGLRRVQRIKVFLDRQSFTVPDVEKEVLQRELTAHLQARVLLGLDVQVEAVWM